MLARHDLWFGIHVLPAPTSGNLSTYVGDLGRAWTNYPGIVSDHTYPVYRCRRQMWTVAADAAAEHLGLTLKPHDPECWARRGVAARSADLSTQASAAGSMFLDTDQTQQRQERIARGLRTIRGWLRNYEVGGLTCAALDHLLEQCRQHQVRVVLAVPPVASEQRALYTPEIEARFQECLRGYCRRYGCRCVDCRAYLPDPCFTDNHHVYIPGGSVPFSRRLATEVIVPEWRGAMPARGCAGAIIAAGGRSLLQ